jgi:hypothetical protein
MSTAQAAFNPFAQPVPSQPGALFAQQPQASIAPPSSNVAPVSPYKFFSASSPTSTPFANRIPQCSSSMRLSFSTSASGDSTPSTIPTFNVSISQASNPFASATPPAAPPASAPGADEGDHISDSESQVIQMESDATLSAPNSVSQQHLNYKKMKTTSKVSQFYTTIVVLSCLYVKEQVGFVGSHRRTSIIFRKVESGLRDRFVYPLPENVCLKDLMTFSYFQGPTSEDDFRRYCTSETEPLSTTMLQFAERLFTNKFTDIKKHITNYVLPKFLGILQNLTGKTNQKSGQAAQRSLFKITFAHTFLGTMRALKTRLQRQMRRCIR